LKSQNGVIGKTDDHYLALRPLLAPDVHPEIENVVQVDIREERRNHRALRVPDFDSDHLPSSITPAFSHFWINRRMRGSATRCSTNLTIQLLSRLSKNPRMSASST